MKALILCAGYATRLYPLTVDKPKHLLPVAGKPMLNHLIEKLEKVKQIDAIYLVTNEKFYGMFEEWQKNSEFKKKIEVFNDKTTSDGAKLGAIGDMKFVIDKAKINDDLFVVAGDNLFRLDVNKFVSFFEKNGAAVALYNVKNLELMKKYSEVKIDEKSRVVSFQEKPPAPESTLAAICMYLFPKKKLNLIEQYINEGNNPDQPGRYIQYLYKREPVYGFVFTESWYDIGDLEQYKQADEDYKKGGVKDG